MGESKKEDKFSFEWPSEVVYIMDTIRMIEKSAKISNELIQELIKIAENESDKEFVEFLRRDSVAKRINDEDIGAKFQLENSEQIMERILVCISLLIETSKKYQSYKYIMEEGDYDLLVSIVGALDWICERINTDDNSIRISELHGLLAACIAARIYLVQITNLFKESKEDTSADTILRIYQLLPPQERASVSLNLFNPNIFATTASPQIKIDTFKALARNPDYKKIIKADVLEELFFLTTPRNQQIFLENIIQKSENSLLYICQNALSRRVAPSYTSQVPYISQPPSYLQNPIIYPSQPSYPSPINTQAQYPTQPRQPLYSNKPLDEESNEEEEPVEKIKVPIEKIKVCHVPELKSTFKSEEKKEKI